MSVIRCSVRAAAAREKHRPRVALGEVPMAEHPARALVFLQRSQSWRACGRDPMNGIIYIVGLVVVVLAILSFLGLR